MKYHKLAYTEIIIELPLKEYEKIYAALSDKRRMKILLHLYDFSFQSSSKLNSVKLR
ncbi:MAG: hypothetical protein QW738_06820 [Nitrososphaeria archaeon]